MVRTCSSRLKGTHEMKVSLLTMERRKVGQLGWVKLVPKPPSKALGSDVVVAEESELEEVTATSVAVLIDAVSVLAESSRRCKTGWGAALWSNIILPSKNWPLIARL